MFATQQTDADKSKHVLYSIFRTVNVHFPFEYKRKYRDAFTLKNDGEKSETINL